MKPFVAVLLLLIAQVATAQSPRSADPRAERSSIPLAGPARLALQQIKISLDQMEPEMQEQMAAVRRDAFIVTRVVAATGALNDFQINSAIQGAINEIEQAQIKAGENPRAPQSTMDMLNGSHELLVKARNQGSMTNVQDVQRELLKRVEPLQRAMFAQLDEARRARIIVSDIRTRLSRWDDSIDQAMVEALSASLSYMRVAPK